MNHSTHARHTSTSPRSDTRSRLTAAIVPAAAVTLSERREMYALLRTYFEGTTRARFECDLRDKEAVILLRDMMSGRVQGFSTFTRMSLEFEGADVVAFFSGDTIIDRDFWGETVLSRAWGETVFAEAERISAATPATRVYWFLISSGYKTWRFLPLFFREFYPSMATPTPAGVQRLLDTLGSRRFGDEYQAERGIVRFKDPAPLRSGVADITVERLRDPRIAFFAQRNPGHVAGDELACLAELSRENLTRAGLRMIRG
jgi:hypothetical protein